MICITNEIIEQQTGIKETTEGLLDKNKLLQMKSGELNQVLETSQKQLQTMTTIPIELINELADAVKQMKEDQQERFEHLLKSLEEVHKKTDKQKCLAIGNTATKSEQSEVNRHAETAINGVVAWAKPDKPNSRTESSSSTISPHLTILNSCDNNGSASPNSDDPASQSEVIVEKEPSSELSAEKAKEDKDDTPKAVTIQANGKYIMYY